MYKMSGIFFATALCVAAMAQPSVAVAQVSSADSATLQGFTLDDAFLGKWKAVQTDAAKDPCHLDAMRVLKGGMGHNGQPQSLSQMASAYDAQPGVHAMLASHGLTATEYMAGVITLFSAGVQQLAAQHPDMVKKGYISSASNVSPANMAYYNAHKDEIHQFSQQLAQQRLQQSGGKMPTCAG